MSLHILKGCVLLGVVCAACAPPKQAGDDLDFDVTLPDEKRSGPSSDDDGEAVSDGEDSSSWEVSPQEEDLTDEQREQMKIALRRGGDKAAQCGQVVEDAETGEGEVSVVMDGKKGRITDVSVGAPFSGSNVESCIKRAFVGEFILPFDGPPMNVPYPIKVTSKKK